MVWPILSGPSRTGKDDIKFSRDRDVRPDENLNHEDHEEHKDKNEIYGFMLFS
jgi:hypothetical protein